MTYEQIEKIRQGSPGKNSDPWVKHWDEMARKTVFRNAFKWAPKSATASKAVALDEQTDAGMAQPSFENVIDAEVTEPTAPTGKQTLDDLAAQGAKADADLAR
jgi:recombination protein RecT